MVLAKLTGPLALLAIACGDAQPNDKDASGDATVDGLASDAADSGLIDTGEACDADPFIFMVDGQAAELLTCCAGVICKGSCAGGQCMCRQISGGCYPYGCCTQPDASPNCMKTCGGPTK